MIMGDSIPVHILCKSSKPLQICGTAERETDVQGFDGKAVGKWMASKNETIPNFINGKAALAIWQTKPALNWRMPDDYRNKDIWPYCGKRYCKGKILFQGEIHQEKWGPG